MERPESRMSFVNNKNNDLKEDFTKLSLCYDDNYKKDDIDNSYEAMDDDDEKVCLSLELTIFLIFRFNAFNLHRWRTKLKPNCGRQRLLLDRRAKKANVLCNHVYTNLPHVSL